MLKRVVSWLWPAMPDPGGVRDEERREIELARQYAASADVLWYAGHRSAAIHHAERGLYYATHLIPQTDLGSSSTPSEGSASGPPAEAEPVPRSARTSAPEALSSEGQTVSRWLSLGAAPLSDLDRKALEKAAQPFARDRVPEIDRDVPSRAGSYYRTLLRLQQASLRPHLSKLHTRFGVWLRRARTIVVAALIVLGIAYLATRPVAPATVTASSSFSATYPASAVIDGKYDSRMTEWILPHSRKVGWVEIRFDSAQTIEQVRIKNASHPPHHTYGTKAFRLEVYEGAKLAFKQEGSFGKPSVKSPWFKSDKIGKRANRIRVYVLSNYGPAGGIAEITWD